MPRKVAAPAKRIDPKEKPVHCSDDQAAPADPDDRQHPPRDTRETPAPNPIDKGLPKAAGISQRPKTVLRRAIGKSIGSLLLGAMRTTINPPGRCSAVTCQHSSRRKREVRDRLLCSAHARAHRVYYEHHQAGPQHARRPQDEGLHRAILAAP